MRKYILGIFVIALFFAACSPSARFSYEQSRKQAPTEIRFENQSKKAKSFEWDFGDGSTSKQPAPEHRYLEAGEYEVTLVVKKGKKTATASKTIMVEPLENVKVAVETTYGTMVIQLYDATPQHRDNFVKLVNEGFYDGLLFHRVIEEFMIQGGDPNSREASSGTALGSGGPGYQIPAEFVDTLYHGYGAVAAARTGDAVNPEKKSSGSQFYIVQGRTFTQDELNMLEARTGKTFSDKQRKLYSEQGGTPFLDGAYTVFGRVVEGLEVIDKIAAQRVDRNNRPVEDVEMKMRLILEEE